MSTETVDYEDLTSMRLDDDALRELVGPGGSCVFNWTTTDGYPVGVVVAYVYAKGKFWTTCAIRRKRVPALRKRPQSAIVIDRNGKTASYKGDSIVHAPGDEDFDQIKGWFYPTLAGLQLHRDEAYQRSFEKFLDSPHRVIIETDPRLIVAFDTVKFAKFTAAAMAQGHGA